MAGVSRYLDAAIQEFSRLPGIGPKSAARVVFHLLRTDRARVDDLMRSLRDLLDNVRECSVCGGIADAEICSICADMSRERHRLCVVQSQKDVLTIESTGVFRGLYHVLHGVISPLDGIMPEDLNLPAMFERCRHEQIRELILALNPTVEGDATSMYIARQLKDDGIVIRRIARGLPVGVDIEFADRATIIKSIQESIEFH